MENTELRRAQAEISSKLRDLSVRVESSDFQYLDVRFSRCVMTATIRYYSEDLEKVALLRYRVPLNAVNEILKEKSTSETEEGAWTVKLRTYRNSTLWISTNRSFGKSVGRMERTVFLVVPHELFAQKIAKELDVVSRICNVPEPEPIFTTETEDVIEGVDSDPSGPNLAATQRWIVSELEGLAVYLDAGESGSLTSKIRGIRFNRCRMDFTVLTSMPRLPSVTLYKAYSLDLSTLTKIGGMPLRSGWKVDVETSKPFVVVKGPTPTFKPRSESLESKLFLALPDDISAKRMANAFRRLRTLCGKPSVSQR